MKLVLFAVLGLLLGTGGGAAMSVMNAKKSFATYDAKRAKVVADSIEQAAQHVVGADSTVVAAADTSHAAPAPADAHGPGGATTTTPPAPETAPQPPSGGGRQRAVATVESHGGTPPTGIPSLVKPVGPGASPPPGSDKLGKIFAAMPAKDAARVLEQLADAEVHDILKSLSDKQAAGIMQFLPSQRAASISKLALKEGHE
jgi:hypothetical protein